MADRETFLIEVYVMVDAQVQAEEARFPRRPGPAPTLALSEVVTLAVVRQLQRFRSGRDFSRFAETHLRTRFPRLPHRTQWLRQVHRAAPLIARLAVRLGAELAGNAPFEVIDCTAMPTRNAKRRGRGWLPGLMDIGFSNRLGFDDGAKVLTCVSPSGGLTGFGAGPASTNDRPLAETLFAQRAEPTPALPSAGRSPCHLDLSDQGFGARPAKCVSPAAIRRGSSARRNPIVARVSGPKRCAAG
jgi:hypothetical protein